MPQFFVPLVDADKQEDAYTEMAALIGAATAPPANRIYSMTWKHNDTEWTATVGEQLRGIATIEKGRGRSKREIRVPRSTNDTVIAIYPGAQFMIMHDNRSKIWNVPIYANPISVTGFHQD